MAALCLSLSTLVYCACLQIANAFLMRPSTKNPNSSIIWSAAHRGERPFVGVAAVERRNSGPQRLPFAPVADALRVIVRRVDELDPVRPAVFRPERRARRAERSSTRRSTARPPPAASSRPASPASPKAPGRRQEPQPAGTISAGPCASPSPLKTVRRSQSAQLSTSGLQRVAATPGPIDSRPGTHHIFVMVSPLLLLRYRLHAGQMLALI